MQICILRSFYCYIRRFGHIGLPQFSGTILKLVLLHHNLMCDGKIVDSRPIPDCTNFCARTNNLFWENLLENNPRTIFDQSSCSHNFTIFWFRKWSQSNPDQLQPFPNWSQNWSWNRVDQFSWTIKYTSLHLHLNCLQNYRCKNPHLGRKDSPFTVSRKKQNYDCKFRWRLGNWVCQLNKFLRAMCLGAFFPAPKLLQVAKERLSWFGAFSAQLNTFSDHFQWRFHCLKSMRLCSEQFLGILFGELLGELVKVF